MRNYVVDSNYLQSRRLREYFEASPNNFALLTDFALMEALKGNTLASIYPSMEIVSSFPQQVKVLKFSSAAKRLRGRPPSLRRRLVDEKQTRNFPKWCRQLELVRQGKAPGWERELLEQGRVASDHMNLIQYDARGYGDFLDKFDRAFTSAEIKRLRSRQPLTAQVTQKLTAVVSEGAAELFALSNIPKVPPPALLPSTFLYRFSLCCCFLTFHWIAVGGVRNVKSSKLRNDMVDLNFATFATFFDGLLSADAKAMEIYTNANFFLTNAKLQSEAERSLAMS
jgi:hypothetical protein